MWVGWSAEVGNAGGLGHHVLDGSFWAGPVMLTQGFWASRPPRPRHLLTRLREERGRCWHCSNGVQVLPTRGSVGPRRVPLQMAPGETLRARSWNVLSLNLALRAGGALGTPVHLGPRRCCRGQHTGKRAGICPGLPQGFQQRLAGSLGATPSLCVRHRQTRALKRHWWGWAWQNGWAASGYAAQRCVLERLSTKGKWIRHWLRRASYWSRRCIGSRLPPVWAGGPEHALWTPGWRGPHHAGWHGLRWRLHDQPLAQPDAAYGKKQETGVP